MAFTPKDFTIVVGGLPVTGFSDLAIVNIEPKPEVPKKKYCLNTDYKVANRTFAEYVTRRMLKDGIGFNPKSDYKEACTDLFSYIASPVPKNDVDFITYCHELGHCKSRQFFSSYRFFNATSSGKWAKERLVSEVNAWKWGIRYFKRLGFILGEETVKVVQWSLNGYFGNAEDLSVAKQLSEEFKIYSDIDTVVPEKSGQFIPAGFKAYVPTPKCEEKPKGWKPWHDLKQKQMKRSWKHCK